MTPEWCTRDLLARYEVRLIPIEGRTAVGVWSFLDSRAIRDALRLVGWDFEIRYLDGAGVPDAYKGTRLAGEPVPLRILEAMEAAIDDQPWEVRDRMLARMRVYDSMEAWLEEQRRRSFANKNGPPVEEAESKPIDPAVKAKRQSALSSGWALFILWRRWDPRAADRHRELHQDKERGDEPWLVELGTASEPHKLRLLLDRLEAALEEVCVVIPESQEREAVNARFMAAFRAELEYARSRSSREGDPLPSSCQALRGLLPVMKRLRQEMAGVEGFLPLLE
jgi:hypothetical protein